jgi:hypothetical protein
MPSPILATFTTTDGLTVEVHEPTRLNYYPVLLTGPTEAYTDYTEAGVPWSRAGHDHSTLKAWSPQQWGMWLENGGAEALLASTRQLMSFGLL